jgi:membrane fusion protein (multidrug efflux system)
MFVRAVVESGVNENAIAVPQQGVTRNPKGEAPRWC